MNWADGPVIHHPFIIPFEPLPITGFGIAVACAFLLGQQVASRELARRGHDAAPVGDILVAAVLGFYG